MTYFNRINHAVIPDAPKTRSGIQQQLCLSLDSGFAAPRRP
jgi:hypothetical protein